MYKNTKSTSHYSVERKKPSSKEYLLRIYESSKTIFVGRNIVSLKLFGDIPTSPPLALISSNKKYLSRLGYLETQVDQLPDWFLFHPKISMLMRCLRETARTKPNLIPFELKLIAFGEPPKPREGSSPPKIRASEEPRLTNYRSQPRLEIPKTPLELAFEKAKKGVK